MQRRLLFVAYKSISVYVQSFETHVRPQQICKGFSTARLNCPSKISHFLPVFGKPRLFQNIPPRQYFSSQADMAEQRFLVEYAKRGTAGCKKCKDKIVKGIVRIGKIVPNPFSESAGEMKEWYHVKCIFEKLERARATTKKIEDLTELEGWEELQDEDKNLIKKHISGDEGWCGRFSRDALTGDALSHRHHSCAETLCCLAELMAKVNASPKKKVQAKLNTSGHLMAPPADPSVNAPRKFSGFTGKQQHLHPLM